MQIFVEKLHWISSTVYLELLALSQCLPGPTSTQVSFALGVVQKGVPGGLLTGTSQRVVEGVCDFVLRNMVSRLTVMRIYCYLRPHNSARQYRQAGPPS